MSDAILQAVSRLKVAKLLTASELSTLVDAVLTTSRATPPNRASTTLCWCHSCR